MKTSTRCTRATRRHFRGLPSWGVRPGADLGPGWTQGAVPHPLVSSLMQAPKWCSQAQTNFHVSLALSKLFLDPLRAFQLTALRSDLLLLHCQGRLCPSLDMVHLCANFSLASQTSSDNTLDTKWAIMETIRNSLWLQVITWPTFFIPHWTSILWGSALSKTRHRSCFEQPCQKDALLFLGSSCSILPSFCRQVELRSVYFRDSRKSSEDQRQLHNCRRNSKVWFLLSCKHEIIKIENVGDFLNVYCWELTTFECKNSRLRRCPPENGSLDRL